MAITPEEAEAIRQDKEAGLNYEELAKKHKKSYRDIKIALTKAEGEEEKKLKPVILPTVTVPKIPVSEWRPTQPRSVDWIFIGPLHVQVEVIELYNYFRERIDPDTTLDEFMSFCVRQFFSIGGITPVIATGFGGQYGGEIEPRGRIGPDEGPRVDATPGGKES